MYYTLATVRGCSFQRTLQCWDLVVLQITHQRVLTHIVVNCGFNPIDSESLDAEKRHHCISLFFFALSALAALS